MLFTKDRPGCTERLRELDGRLRGRIRELRALEFDIGRLLLDIRRLGDFTALGSTTCPMYCESVGLSPVEGRELLAMVEAAEVLPEVETRVVEARLSPQKATVIHEIQRKTVLQRPGEDLLALAEKTSGRDFTEELKRRREEARIGRPPVTRTIHFSAEESDAVDRTREVVSGMLQRMVSDGEAVGKACGVFLDLHDRERQAKRLQEKDESVGASEARPRGAGTVQDLERSRHIAAMTTRDLIRVCGQRCWVNGCPNRIFLERCHRRPFRANGSNALWNLLYLCPRHHGGYDGGLWGLRRRQDGVWIVISRSGSSVGELRPEAGRFLDAQEARGRAPP